MTKAEATKLLALIKIAYPTAYRDMDDASKKATVNMWYMSFPDAPYPIMEQAFNQFRMVNKFPPTVAEIVEELRKIHYQAMEQAGTFKMLGNEQALRQCMLIMDCTKRYKDNANLGGVSFGNLMNMRLEAPANFRQGLPGGEYE